MRRYFSFLLILAALVGTTSIAAAQGSDPNDEDGDGVPNATDRCPRPSGPDLEIVQTPEGCPPFYAKFVGLDVTPQSILGRQGRGNFQAQCYHAGADACRFRVAVTLSAASAKKLKLGKRTIADDECTTNKYVKQVDLKFVNCYLELSKAVRKALKNAKRATITVRVSYVHGSSARTSLGSDTAALDKNGEDVGLSNRPARRPGT